MGNAEPMLHEAVGRSDLTGAIAVILEFLQGYNEDSPYCRIERWDPDYRDDDDDNEFCYEHSGPHDCVVCSRDCGYRDDAESRCWEYHEDDPEYCIECRDCDYHSTAEDDCHGNQMRAGTPARCVLTCRRSQCNYHADYDACHECHDGSYCKGCDAGSDCPHYESDDEEPEETDEAPTTPTGEPTNATEETA
jgi:hypothetical protein